MIQRYIICFLILITISQGFSQVQPLSRKDSGLVLTYQQKYEEFATINDKEASRFLNEIAFIYWNHNQYQTAIDYYERSLSLNNNVSNENGIAMLNGNLGLLYSDIGKYPISLKYFEKTLAARRSMGEPVSLISALINTSVVLNNLGRYEESVKNVEEALSFAREMNDPKQMMSCYAMISETYEKAGNPDKSIQYFNLYKSFYNKVHNDEISGYESKLEAETLQKKLIEAQKTKKENELLKKQLEIKSKDEKLTQSDSINKNLNKDLSLTTEELEIQRIKAELIEGQKQAALMELENQKKTRNSLLVAFLLLTVIAGLILFIYRRARKLNALLQDKNKSIESQRKQLEEANAIKDKLFSIVAHDLRSPFASLISFFYILDDSKLPEDVRSIFDELKQQVALTSDLLDNLLYWAKSQIEGFKPQIDTISLSELVNENIELLNPLAAEKKIKLFSSIPDELCGKGDNEMIKLVIRNLIQNAIKFTPEQGRIEVHGGKDFGNAYVRVKDSGLGMTEEKINSLFELNTNKSTSGTNNEQGTGLGLVLCNEFIQKNNGEFVIESEIEKGTSIGFIIEGV